VRGDDVLRRAEVLSCSVEVGQSLAEPHHQSHPDCGVVECSMARGISTFNNRVTPRFTLEFPSRDRRATLH
jgi:hypothetical protein